MRYVRASIIAILVLLVSGVIAQPARAADVSFGFFYSNLSPHGSWLVSDEYGRVWQPAAYGPGWNPYYDGHWVYTDVGWTWVSDYPWGAVCYHYGTWVPDPAYGWVWVPGYVWAPAWVVFRTGPDYIGWAPVAPGYALNASFSFGAREAGPFVFVSSGNFLAPRIRSVAVHESRTRIIINNTRVVNNLVVERNVVVNRGPDVGMVEKASKRRIREIPIERVPRAAPGSRVSRDQLAVDPQRMKRGVRAAEPESARSPSPANRGASPDKSKGQLKTEASAPPRVRGAEPRAEIARQRVVRESRATAPGAPTRRTEMSKANSRRETYATRSSRPQPSQGANASPAKAKNKQQQQGKKQRRPAPRKPDRS